LQKKRNHSDRLTDLPSSPIYPLCDYVLFARSNIISFVDTLVAPLSLVNALIVGVGLMNEKNTQQVLSKLEDLWDEYFTYSTAGEKKTSFDT
jgi:DNA-binding MurR/RpiR family transcriptional regulator